MIRVTPACVALIKKWESLKLKAYLCPAKVPTIGWGTIRYPNGIKVKLGDKCTAKQAEEWLMHEINQKAYAIDPMLSDNLTDNQYAAIISFTYNLGEGALRSSTLLRKVNTNPNDPTIRNEFMKWVFAGDGTKNGKDDDGDGLIDEAGEKAKLDGLVARRKEEADLYFKK